MGRIDTGPLKKSNVHQQACSDWLKNEMLRLFCRVDAVEQENLRMREALEYYAHPDHYEERNTLSGLRPAGVLVDKGELAQKILRSILHTDRLAKQREADLEVLEIALNIIERQTEAEFTISSGAIAALFRAIQKRERVYGDGKVG